MYRITRPAAFAAGCLRYTYEWRMLMRKKVRKSLAFLLALALVVSVMSGLGLSVSADEAQPQTEPAQTEEVQDEAVKETPKVEESTPKEGEEEEEADPDAEAVPEEKKDEQKAEGEGSGDAVKDTTADSNGNQKDEPQAEPAAGDTVDVSKLLGKQLYDYMNTLDDEAYDAAWKELSETQKASYESYVKEVMFGKNPKIITETVTHGAAVSVTNAAGLMTFSNSGVRMKAAAMRAVANTSLSDKKVPAREGLVMNKTISKDVKDTTDTKYTIQLESYAAGKVTTSTKSTPCDIVLVLDESGSMAYDFETTYEYKKLLSNTQNSKIWDYYKDVLYVKPTDGSEPIKVELDIQEEGYFPFYTYTYTYTYTYKGVVYKKLFDDGNIPSRDNEPDFFADGIEKQLYYGKRVSGIARKAALQTAATNFLDSVSEDAATSKANHRIAVVGFAKNSSTKIGLTAVDNQAGKGKVKNAIDRLGADNATNTGSGMNRAVNIFKESEYQDDYDSGARKKVVILFTDGVPTTSNTFDENVANTAITAAGQLKSSKTTIYTIGIFKGADANAAIKYTWGAGEGTQEETENANTFMQFVSSNFPNAQNMSSGGTGDIHGGYYLTAKNTADLNKIFDSISESIGESTIQLDGTTQTIDKMSADFKLPNGTSSADIKVYKVPYKGKDSAGNDTFETDETNWEQVTQGITVDTANDTVTVTRFDYTKDYVVVKEGKPQGYKLVVRIPAEYKNEAWFGGNDIESNDIGSGIYNGGSCYGTFEVPKVNRAIDYKIVAKDQTIYVTNPANLQELLNYAAKDSKTYKPDGKNNKYVDIVYTLKKGDTIVGTYKISKGESEGIWQADGAKWNPADLTDCTTYTWTCTVTPKDSDGKSLGVAGMGNTAAERTECDSANGTVHVLYPTVKAADKFIYWGESVTPADQITVEQNWTELHSNHNADTPDGTKPTITKEAEFKSDEKGNTPSKDSDYNVIAKIGEKDITQLLRDHNRIVPDRKAHESCDDTTGVTDTTTANDFRIHVKVKKLTVKKIVGGNMGDTNQDFKFTGGKIYTNDAKKTEVTDGFTLKHGKKETFKLKVSDKVDDDVSITEEPVAGYKTSYKVGSKNEVKSNTYNYGKVEATSSPDEVTVTFTNDKTIQPPNGIITTIAPYAIMVVLAAGAGVYFVYSRRRRNH